MTAPACGRRFDMARFRDDVRRWQGVHSATNAELAGRAGIAALSLARWLYDPSRGLSLDVACSLADVCNLSLDRYRV